MDNNRTAELEALMQTEGAEWDGALTAFIAKAQARGAEIIQAQEVWGQELTSGGYGSVGAWPDAAENTAVWMVLTNPSEYATQAVSYIRYTVDGVLKEAIVLNANGHKADSTNVIQLGSKFHTWSTGHALQGNPRANSLNHGVWDVGAVPYAAGQKPKTGVGAAPATEQIFADVPPGSTFYDYVQQLAAQGAIGGYPCGGPGEPCDDMDRPYFRPNNTLTRGQLCKVVALAMEQP